MRVPVGVLFLVLVTLQPASAAPIERGFDRPGSDIARRELRIPAGAHPSDPRDHSWRALYARWCRQACEADQRCVAWTMVNAGIQGPNAMCWLKSQAPRPVANACCTSGTIAGR